MKIYRLKNRQNEDISVRFNINNIQRSSSVYREDITMLPNDIPINDSNFDTYVNAFNNGHFTVNIPENIRYRLGSTIKKGTIVRFKGQPFICRPDYGNSSSIKPNEYSPDWVAFGESYTSKCIGIDANRTDTVTNTNRSEFGNMLFKLPSLLDSGNFYKYYRDGDYFILVANNNTDMFTMRLNYREWFDKSTNQIYVSVDAISDEVIPGITFRLSSQLEADKLSYEKSLKGVSIKSLLDKVFSRVESYYTNNFTNCFVQQQFGEKKSIKYGNYKLYVRDNMTGPYNLSESRYMDTTDTYTSQPANMIGHVWLPIEKEIFGRNYKSLTSYTDNSFNQYQTLDTAFKRVKYLVTSDGNYVAKPWMTFSIYKGTRNPVIVGKHGENIPIDTFNVSGGYNEEIYVPLCITLATYVKK
jgi:hypothetical protein